MRKLPPLGSLRAFEAAARRKSFAAAAEELGVTPTAISHQIRSLEEICGRPLFRRRPRPISLTGAGERLFPIVRDGFDSFAEAIAYLDQPLQAPLRITTPNAFASRWLIPCLPLWRAAHPATTLEVIGTDAVIDLRSNSADVAIRYSRRMPGGVGASEIFRDSFFPVCSPHLLSKGGGVARAIDLLQHPLIHFDWMNRDPEAPTLSRWLQLARSIDPAISEVLRPWDLSFREEHHAIDAVVAGQGIAVCSDIVVGRELASGTLVKAHELSLPGYGFYLVSTPSHPRRAEIEAFSDWMRSQT